MHIMGWSPIDLGYRAAHPEHVAAFWKLLDEKPEFFGRQKGEPSEEIG